MDIFSSGAKVVVFIANAINTPHASRLRYTARRTQAYVRVYTALALARGDSKLRSDVAGKGRRDRKAPKAASHDATSDCKKI